MENKVLCPHCGVDLMEYGVGEVFSCHQVYYSDGSYDDIIPNGETLEWYCPHCEETISEELKDKVLGE